MKNYTARQISLYFDAAVRLENKQQANAIVATNLGFNGGKEAKKAIQALVA